jgi:hypothetical protein
MKMVSNEFERDMLDKMEAIELKKEIMSILHGLQYDDMYKIEDCIVDLHKFLITLDRMENSHTFILKRNSIDLAKRQGFISEQNKSNLSIETA